MVERRTIETYGPQPTNRNIWSSRLADSFVCAGSCTYITTLIHAFITARLDYCSSLYAGLPVGRLWCLDRVLRTAARHSGRIPKFGHVSRYMLDVLHWLPRQQRISYRIISLAWRSLLGLAPAYLRDLCHTTTGIPGRRSLRSTGKGLLLVPFAHTAIM